MAWTRCRKHSLPDLMFPHSTREEPLGALQTPRPLFTSIPKLSDTPLGEERLPGAGLGTPAWMTTCCEGYLAALRGAFPDPSFGFSVPETWVQTHSRRVQRKGGRTGRAEGVGAQSTPCPFLPRKDSSVLRGRSSPPASASRRKTKPLKERGLCPGRLWAASERCGGFANHAEDGLGRAGAELAAPVHRHVPLLVTHKSSGVRQPQGPGPSPSQRLPPEHPVASP